MGWRFSDIKLTDVAEIEKWLSGDSLRDVIVMFTRPPYAPEILSAVNQLCGRYGEKVQVNFQASNLDGSFTGTELRQLPNLVSLLIMSARPVAEIRRIWELPALRRLDPPRRVEGDRLRPTRHPRPRQHPKRSPGRQCPDPQRETERLSLQ